MLKSEKVDNCTTHDLIQNKENKCFSKNASWQTFSCNTSSARLVELPKTPDDRHSLTEKEVERWSLKMAGFLITHRLYQLKQLV